MATNNSINNSFKNSFDLDEISTPSNPSANILRIYAKDVSGSTHLFALDSEGNELDLSLSYYG